MKQKPQYFAVYISTGTTIDLEEEDILSFFFIFYQNGHHAKRKKR
jgi:hypothetical protein